LALILESTLLTVRGNTWGQEMEDIEDRTFELRRRLQFIGTKSAKRQLKKSLVDRNGFGEI